MISATNRIRARRIKIGAEPGANSRAPPVLPGFRGQAPAASQGTEAFQKAVSGPACRCSRPGGLKTQPVFQSSPLIS